ncbi:MAG: TonB-dependent receptor [Sporocytophaga sp.]|uniref:TonB-dependent receptor n=1 Tax=Sporocytophaga sp. TaxID=2231183 RepID=UPI001B26EC42|nr:TonB-dependent receptor [Sporocytophaga sp.]MBO9701438.1 TonB-dependent receptor [Sporocytophaga sp.]
MKVRILLVFALLLFSSMVCAQVDSANANTCRFRLEGDVKDGETNTILPGAMIVIDGGAGTVSDDVGHFHFTNLCKGKYKITVTFLGYKTIVQTLDLNENLYKTFILHSDSCLLESIIITSSKPVYESSQSVQEISGRALDRTRGFSLGESLKGIAGVNTLQTGPSIFKPVIQGMYGNRVLILSNGVRLEGQQWGSEHAPEIDPFIADKIKIVKGASGVLYGSDAIGGVILVEPRPLRSKSGVGGEFNLAGFSNNREGVVSGIIDYSVKQVKGLSFRVQGTLKYAGNSKTPDYYMRNTAFREQNFSWAAGYKREEWGIDIFYSQFNSKIGILSASHIGNRDDLIRAIKSPVPLETSGFSYAIERPYQEIYHELGRLHAFRKFHNKSNLELILARQFNDRSEYDKHRPYKDQLKDGPQSRFKITTYTGTVYLNQNYFKKYSGTWGLSFIQQANTVRFRSFIPNFRSYAGGIFLTERRKFESLELEGGLRYDYKWMRIYKYENGVIISPSFVFSNISGTIGAVKTIDDHLKVRLNIGTCFRPPAVSELFSDGLHHGTGRIEKGDKKLNSEYAYNTSLTFDYKFKKIYGEVNLYNNYIKDYIYLVPGRELDSSGINYVPEFESLISGTSPVFRYVQTDAMFTGIDLTFNDSLSKHFIFSTRLSLLRAYNTKARENIILTPPANMENGLKYSFNRIPSLKEAYLKVGNTIVLQKKNVPSDQDLKAPPKGYTLWSLETGFGVMAGKQELYFTITVYNLLNKKYRDYLDAFRYFTDEPGRNFVVRLKVPFDLSKK